MSSQTRRWLRSMKRMLAAIPREELEPLAARLEKIRDQFSTEPTEPATTPTTPTARRRTRRRGQ